MAVREFRAVFRLEACHQDPYLLQALPKPASASHFPGVLGWMPGHPGFILRPLPKEEVFTGKREGKGPSQVKLVVKNPPGKAADARDAGSIPG